MKHQHSARALSAAVALAALGVAAIGAQAQTATMRMPASDADFVRALAAGNTAELDEAKYIVNRTKDATVRAFAQHMIDDHSSAAVKLEAATRGTNLAPAPPSTDTNAMGARAVAMLSAESGPQADNDYMRLQAPQHQRALALLQWESQNGQNAGLKAVANALIPTVQQHLQMTQQFLAAHNLTPYAPPGVNPVPGNPNGTPTGNGGSTLNNNGSGGTTGNPIVAPTYAPTGSGTPPPVSPSPAASPKP